MNREKRESSGRMWYVAAGVSAAGILLTAALSAFGSDLGHAIARWFGM